MKTSRKALSATLLMILAACGSKGFQGKSAEQAAGSKVDGSNANPITIPVLVDGRKVEDILCTDGPTTMASLNKVDFSEQFAAICTNGKTNALFGQLLANAYSGSGEPQPQVIKKKVGELYVTDISLAYALKVPLENPTLFADLKPHDVFSKGIAENNSNLTIKVTGRTPFPGKRSVEQVLLDYNLTNADGAGIYDKRKTEFNTYPLIENNRDITISAENLLEAESNDSYHQAQGLMIGIRAGDGSSYLIFVNQLVVKNRIDPDRMERTLLSLNKGAAKMLMGLFKK